MDMTFASLMVRANDEPDAMYGLAAKSVQISADKLTYRFTMRPEARFHDGSKLTAHDAAFSLTTLKTKGHPLILQQMRDMVKAEALDDATLVVTFAEKRARDVPLYVASLPIFSQGLLRDAAVRRIDARYPAGIGAVQGRQVRGQSLHRIRAGQGLVGRRSSGHRAAASISIPCVTNSTATAMSRSRASPAKNYLFREEFTARVWATRYDFPAVKDGRVKQEILPDETPSGAQGWFINIRRDKFRDPRVREALIQAFDFEWTNKTIMYGAYARTHSPFQNSDMMANGPPSPEELKLLEPFRGQVPDEVFGMPFVPPVSDGSGQDRTLLRKASQLLAGRRAASSRTASGCCRTARFSRSNFWSTSRRCSRITRPTSRISARSGSRRRLRHRRSRAIPRPGAKISIST